MNKKSKKKSLLVMLLLMAVLATASLASGTYAKYTSTIEDVQGEAIIALWNFDVENEHLNDSLEIDFTETYDETTLLADRIAPGTEGSFGIKLANETSEVGVDYAITIADLSEVPTYLSLYKDANHTEALAEGDTIEGFLEQGQEETTVLIYWAWPYESNDDETDTTEGKAGGASGTKFVVTMDITGTQTLPTAATD